MDSNPYNFRHYNLENFAMLVGGTQIPPEGVNLLMDSEKTAVMEYRTLFEGSGIHHSNSGFQITPDKYINGFYMLVFDLHLTLPPQKDTHQTPKPVISG